METETETDRQAREQKSDAVTKPINSVKIQGATNHKTTCLCLCNAMQCNAAELAGNAHFFLSHVAMAQA
eukprot:1792138-Amphidinium_carterae.2